jgi:hypothetical protein
MMMKRQSMKCTQRGSWLAWTDRVTGNTLHQFNLDDIAASVRDAVFAYGARQIIADGGADADSMAERIAKMTVRSMSLMDGSWGTRKASFVDADIFAAAVMAGLIPDTEEAREKWIALKPAQRRAVGAREDVRAHMVEADGDAAADILSQF